VTSNLYGSMDLDSMNLKTEYGDNVTEEFCKKQLVQALTLRSFDVYSEVPTTSSPVQRADIVAYPRVPLVNWDWGYLLFEIKRGGLKIRNEVGQQMHSYANAIFRNEMGATFTPTAVILFPCRAHLALGPNFGHAFFEGGTLKVFVNNQLIIQQRDTAGNMEVIKKAKDVIKHHKTESPSKQLQQPTPPFAAKSPTTPSSISIAELADLLSTKSDRVIEELRKHGLIPHSDGSTVQKLQTVDRASVMSLIQSKKILQGHAIRDMIAVPFSDPISLYEAAKIALVGPAGMENRIQDYPAFIRRVVVRAADGNNRIYSRGENWIYSRGELEKAGLLVPRKALNRRAKILVPHDSRLPQSIAGDQSVDRKNIHPLQQGKIADLEKALNELRQAIAERDKVVDGWAFEFSRRLSRLEGVK
jgi:hypothetical protein